MQDLLKDIRTILVLPDRSKDTVGKAFKLLPRFLTYTDEGVGMVTAVLKKMLSNCHPVEDKGDGKDSGHQGSPFKRRQRQRSGHPKYWSWVVTVLFKNHLI